MKDKLGSIFSGIFYRIFTFSRYSLIILGILIILASVGIISWSVMVFYLMFVTITTMVSMPHDCFGG